MVISLQDVTWQREGREILHGLDWTVRKGQHWALLGLNGSGKTTLLNMLSGYIWPTRGRVQVLDQDFGTVDLRELRKSIGLVSSALQETLYSHETVLGVVLSGKFATLGLYDEPSAKDRDKALAWLSHFGCEQLLLRCFSTLSQGERQRVMIARALMADPRLLILDEPCTGLDLFARERLLQTIAALTERESAPTLIYVSHHVEEILPAFNHTLLLRDGTVFAKGETQAVLTEDNLTAFFKAPIGVHWQDGRAFLYLVS